MAGINMNVVEMMDMVSAREIYGKKIAELANIHPEIVALSADVAGTNKFGDFKKAHPDRFFNVGIAEQNLMSVAAGLALEGKVPFASTFATFASMRAHEQVRTDIAYTNLPVKIIATVGGLSGGQMGPTHQGMEDIGTMRMMPNMTVIAPGDPLQLGQFITQGLSRGYVAFVVWTMEDAWYDRLMPYGVIGTAKDGFPLKPSYHMLRLFTHTVQPGWRAMKVDGDPNGRIVSAARGPNGEFTILALNQIEAPQRVVLQGLPRDRQLHSLGWNHDDGLGRLWFAGGGMKLPGGRIVITLPAQSMAVFTTVDPKPLLAKEEFLK